MLFSILPPLLLMTLCHVALSGLAQTNAVTNLFAVNDYLIDDQHSYIGFKIKYFGFSPVRGRFNEFNGHVLYDEKDISKTSVTLFIDVASINTGVEMRDNDLKTSHWFGTEKISYNKISEQKSNALK